jgi:hypothetical protein
LNLITYLDVTNKRLIDKCKESINKEMYMKTKIIDESSQKELLENVKLTKQDRIEAYKRLFVDDEEWINEFLEDRKEED